MQFTNFEISVLWYIGSGTISRLTICAFLGIETSDIKLRISGTCPQNTKSIFLILIWNLPGYPQPGLAPGSRVFLLLSLRPLRTVFGARLLPVRDACCVQRSTYNVVPNARQILYTAAADQDDRVFLQIVADTGDVGCYFNPIGQTHTCNFAKGRIRLFGRLRFDLNAHTSFLRTFLQSRTTRLVLRFASTLSNQLIK